MAFANFLGINNHTSDNLNVAMRSQSANAFLFYAITDRTQADVDRVKYLIGVILDQTNTEEEWEEFTNNLKGALNYSDLDRIEGNINLLIDWIGLSDDMEDMTRDTIPRIPYYQAVLWNVSLIRNSWYHYASTPSVPDMPLNTYDKINDIEKILLDAYRMFLDNITSRYYCDTEIYSGEGIGIL